MNKNTPNLFCHATTELSQDAVLCWLVDCAKNAEGDLRQCGLDFIGVLMKHGREQYRNPCVVTEVCCPKKQYQGIDVYFQAKVDGSLVSFVVEDKTGGSMHSNQLERYKEVVRQDEDQEDEFRLVYYKTGYVYEDELVEAEAAGYVVFDAKDMLCFLNSQPAVESNEILYQYRDFLAKIVSCRQKALDEWNWEEAHVLYEFMKLLRNALIDAKDQWEGSLKEKRENQTRLIRGVNTGGRPWTQHWFSSPLFWRMDGGWNGLRLMVWTENAQNLDPGWGTDAWEHWIEIFESLASKHGLECDPFRRRMRGSGPGGLVREGTVGAIALPSDAAEKTIPSIVDMHVDFLREIALPGDAGPRTDSSH